MYYIYILTDAHNNVFYVGVNNDLIRRTFEHKEKLVKGFTQKYNIDKLVYYESTESVEPAILREKYLKGKTKKFKIELINKENSDFDDLYYGLI